ncbi:MAG: NAD(P)-dependent oxidoreductase [Bacteroidia bacterium]|nr:NAD(P)-dependent oxidoreductase [Bacteroidia bacterium]
MSISVLLTESYHPFLLSKLTLHKFLSITHIESPTLEHLLSPLSHAHVWIMRGAIPVDGSVLRYAPRLQLIIRAGSGTEHIDKKAIQDLGIQLRSTPHANALPVAEYVVAAILMLSRRFLSAHHLIRDTAQWARKSSMGRELASLTVGIIGFGQNGSRTAQILATLGAKILAYDKYKGGFGGAGVTETTLERIYEEADVLSLHVPLTAETAGWIDSAFLRNFRKPIAVINAARGGILSLPAVVEGLETGRLWGAAIDTLPAEPPTQLTPSDYESWEKLRKHPAVLLTPHIAGLTEESELRLAQAVWSILEEWLANHTQPQGHEVNPI